MSAQSAYEIARHRIGEHLGHHSDVLSLSDLSGLERLPSEIGDLRSLKVLGIENTQVRDLEPIAALNGLIELHATGSKILDLSPLRALRSLRELDLSDTLVSDISPLRALPELERLNLSGTQVGDLRPLLLLYRLLESSILVNSTQQGGIWFDNTVATRNDPELAGYSLIESMPERVARTFEYLDTLPPWPEPLPWEAATAPDGGLAWTAPPLPGPRPAPVMVRLDATGHILPDAPTTSLEDAARTRAFQAWQALDHYLKDLAPLRHKVDNAMPALGRAFASFERALGSDFDTLNEIDLGMQAARLSALSAHADDALMPSDATELATFTAQLALYMQRFNAWSAYQQDIATAPSPDMSRDRATFEDLTEDLVQTGQVADAVTVALADVTSAATEPDATPLQKKGATDSQANVLDAVAERALAEKRALEETPGGYSRDIENAALGAFIGSVVRTSSAAGSVWAILFLYRNQDNLERLASRYPALNFITGVLRFLFPA